MRGTVTVILLVLAVLVSAAASGYVADQRTNIFFAALLGLVGLFVYNGCKKIQADPPTKAIPTFLGKPLNETLDSGWHFFPLYPLLFDYIEINGGGIELLVTMKDMRTPDGIKNDAPFFLVFKVDDENPVPFLLNDKDEGVKSKLRNVIIERMRQWMTSRSQGPQNYEEAREAGEEALALILKAIVGFEKIKSDIPTTILLKFFGKPRKPPTPSEAAIWGAEWQKVKKTLKPLRSTERAALEKSVAERRSQIEQAMLGQGNFEVKNLGIVISLASLGDIEPSGDLAKATDRVAVAKIEQRVKDEMFANRARWIKRLRGRGLGPKEAADFVQTEDGSVQRTIQEKKVSFDHGLVEAIKEVLLKILERTTRENERGA